MHTTGTANGRPNDERIGSATCDDRSPNNLANSGSTNEDLAALDRLITYLLGQPSNTGNNNLDTWRRSRHASARGYRQLHGAGGTVEAGNVGTTPL